MPIIEASNLHRHYAMGESTVRALDGVSFTVNEGEFVGLLGTSGSGKSTLLNLIAGLDRPTGGDLKIFDRSLADMSRQELALHRRRNVGMIFQSFNLIPTMTARDNVTLPLMFAAVAGQERERRAEELLASVGLSGRQLHKPNQLSGGEQQRVSIARALANSPSVLLADEPTGNLDSKTARGILELLQELQTAHGKTVVMVTHDQALASHYTGRVITLLDGKVIDSVAQ
jgi:putative ABC transport system ATP-binding protein